MLQFVSPLKATSSLVQFDTAATTLPTRTAKGRVRQTRSVVYVIVGKGRPSSSQDGVCVSTLIGRIHRAGRLVNAV
jgi:hypothetical protein